MPLRRRRDGTAASSALRWRRPAPTPNKTPTSSSSSFSPALVVAYAAAATPPGDEGGEEEDPESSDEEKEAIEAARARLLAGNSASTSGRGAAGGDGDDDGFSSSSSSSSSNNTSSTSATATAAKQTITGAELRALVFKKFGRDYEVRLVRRGSRMFLHVMWASLEQKSYGMGEEEHQLQLDAVAACVSEWRVAAAVRQGVKAAKYRPGFTVGGRARAVSIPLGVEVGSGGRASEWL